MLISGLTSCQRVLWVREPERKPGFLRKSPGDEDGIQIEIDVDIFVRACCHRNGRGTWILSAGGCPGPRSLHRCLLYLGDWNSGSYWECLGHVCLFQVSGGVMVQDVL